VARVVELTCYPIKGCAGTSLSDACATPAGLAHDRSFMIVDENGVFRTQRRTPRLATIRPEVDAAGTRLILQAPDTGPMSTDVDLSAARRDVHLFGVPYRGIDQGDEVAAWLSEVLGVSSRLVRVPPQHDRMTGGATPGTTGYADSSPLLVTAVLSLDLLNERIIARGGRPVPMNRFRPNIVIDGWNAPHAEDRARRIRVGEAEFGYSKLAIRCAVTTVEQCSGVKVGPEPLRTLADYRRAVEGGVAFGAKFAVVRPGTLSVGDDVTVSDWGPSEL
jgi:uncharacterized protein YcbX